jgi:hypothetical protein
MRDFLRTKIFQCLTFCLVQYGRIHMQAYACCALEGAVMADTRTADHNKKSSRIPRDRDYTGPEVVYGEDLGLVVRPVKVPGLPPGSLAVQGKKQEGTK